MRTHPAVLRDEIGSYLGIPLLTPEEHALGSLCAIDSLPRVWSERDVALLTELAQSAITEIELRRELRRRTQYERVHPVPRDSLHGVAGGGGYRALRGQQGRLVRQRPGRIRDRAVQDGSDLASRPLAGPGRRGVRHPRVGLMVQPPPPLGTPRVRSAGRVRGGILPPPRDSESRGGTHQLSPPENPARFSTQSQALPSTSATRASSSAGSYGFERNSPRNTASSWSIRSSSK